MKFLINKYILGIFILLITFLTVHAEEKKKKPGNKKNKNKFEERLKNMSSERKDFIFSEFDSDGDGVLNEEERKELRKKTSEHRKNNQ